MICGLCGQNRELRNSHIIPEFLYKPLYDADHRAMGINGLRNSNWQYIQKGLREKLLCDNCEQLLNHNYEQYFLSFWVNNKAIPLNWPRADLHTVSGIDYCRFKLFHLSILFRASISKLPIFEFVSLEPHEAIIRRMLLENDPGTTNRYHVFAYAAIKSDNSIVQEVITRPIKTKFDGHVVYSLMFSGCMWNYMVSNHASPRMAKVALNQEGKLYLRAVRWERIPIIKAIAEILKR